MAVTYLKVEYREKDLARSLGARWDSGMKQWYVPQGCDPAPFARWLPLTEALPKLTGEDQDTACSLSQLLARVSQAVARVTPMAEWVKAEISEFRPSKNGHIHLNLVELDAHKNLLGKASATIFKAQAEALLAKFWQATGSQLGPEMKVLLQVRVQFHIQYGFSLVIEDIDPAYTLGDIAAKLAAIRDTLQQEGVFFANKRLASPREFYRLAVLSPQSAAGLGDFRQEADVLQKYGLCHFSYYHAQFQGEVAAGEISSALHRIIDDHAKHAFDAVAIIRGGGATIDLAWLNDLSIARQVCLSPLPVFSGIGHERDNTILDEVAQQRFDTPSKVIGHIVTTIVHNAKQASSHLDTIHKHIRHSLHLKRQQVDDTYRQINTTLQHRLDTLSIQLSHLHGQIVTLADNQCQLAQTLIERHFGSVYQTLPTQVNSVERDIDALLCTIYASSQSQLEMLHQQVDTYRLQIYENIGRACYDYDHKLQQLLLSVVSLGPEPTLKRGFALAATVEGQPIVSMACAKQYQRFTIRFYDGDLTVQPIGSDHDR